MYLLSWMNVDCEIFHNTLSKLSLNPSFISRPSAPTTRMSTSDLATVSGHRRQGSRGGGQSGRLHSAASLASVEAGHQRKRSRGLADIDPKFTSQVGKKLIMIIKSTLCSVYTYVGHMNCKPNEKLEMTCKKGRNWSQEALLNKQARLHFPLVSHFSFCPRGWPGMPKILNFLPLSSSPRKCIFRIPEGPQSLFS